MEPKVNYRAYKNTWTKSESHCTNLLLYDGSWPAQEGGKVSIAGGSATTKCEVGSKRSGSGRAATNLMENINLSLL
jgi:hypothetical protein